MRYFAALFWMDFLIHDQNVHLSCVWIWAGQNFTFGPQFLEGGSNFLGTELQILPHGSYLTYYLSLVIVHLCFENISFY